MEVTKDRFFIREGDEPVIKDFNQGWKLFYENSQNAPPFGRGYSGMISSGINLFT